MSPSSLRTSVRSILASLVFLAVGIAPRAIAQSGSNVDVITGTITDGTGAPVVGATIEAFSIETEVTKRQDTNDKGRFTIFFNDGGGQYRITVRAIGKQPFIANVTRQSDDDRITFNVKLGERPVQLQDLTARAQRAPTGNENERPTPGSTERNISAAQAARLPIDASDLAALAALVPGVVMVPGTDSTPLSFQIAGQSSGANNFVVDGLSSTGTNIPQDAIRNTRVITNTFDVSRGGFSGGQVSATTRGGSNVVQGSVTGNFRDKNLAFGSATDNVFTSGQTQQNISGGFGGPLKRDKIFLFGSFSTRRDLSPMASLDAADATTLARLGASPDSVSRFIQLANGTGLTQRVGVVDPNRTALNYSGSFRFDWNAADRHTLTIRGDANNNKSDPTRIGQTQLPQVGGDQTGSGGGVAASLASRIGVQFINELRVGYNTSKSESTPFLYVPTGRVQNFSTLDDGTVSFTTFGFGGNSGLPQESSSKSLEIRNNLSWLPDGGVHRFSLGLLLNRSSFTQDVTNNRFGSYVFNSLADFEANRPASFTRTLQPTIRNGSSQDAAVYLSDVLRPSQNLQFTFGGRLENTSYDGAPARNTDAEQRFGIRTDILPNETYFTPRFGFSLTVPSAEQQGQGQRGFQAPALVIRGGVGLFRGTMPSTLPGTAQAQAGLSTTETQLFCVGSAVPLPNWNDFANNDASIPTQCLNGESSPIFTGRPTVTTYADGYGAPKTWRGSLGLSKRFWNTYAFNLDASYVRGIGQGGTRDLNLVSNPAFTLTNEGNRPVYATAAQIDPRTGAVPLTASRVDPGYGAVRQLFSSLENETKQLTASVNAFTRRGALLNLSYTFQHSRDQGGSGGGGGFGARGGADAGGGGNLTSGDPRNYEWARSSNERTHNVQANVTWPFNQGLEVTAVANVTSGSRYTPTVGGDINGDGSRNDRAYVFNPSTANDPALATAMADLLASDAGSCLKDQVGQIATRNSCKGPWTPNLSLQVNWRPAMFDRRLSVSFSTINLLGGLDELFNGADNLKGWGGFARPDNTLLTAQGFDASTNTYRYKVNERFGATSSGATAVRSPFQVGVQLRYVIGVDQRREMLRRAAGITGQGNFAQQMIANLPMHVAKAAIERKDSLALTANQIIKLQAIADSADAARAPILASLEAEVAKAGANPDMQALFPKLQPLLELLRRESTEGVAAVRLILTDVQWALLPEAVRNPQNNLFGGGRGAGGAGGPGGQGRPGGGGRDGGGRPDFE